MGVDEPAPPLDALPSGDTDTLAAVLAADEVIDEVNVGPPAEDEYPTGAKLILILSSVLLGIFLVALDRTILATAIPKITDDFEALDDIGWYASAYMLANSALQLFFGRIYKFYSTKWIFIICILIFEVGSALCGAAPTSNALIVGRAIAGAGSAGIFSGGLLIISYSVPLHKRPMVTGLFGAVFGISSVIGPLLGGAFTDSASLTWRWCFYINLPIGAVTLIVLFFILDVPPAVEAGLSFQEQLARLDPIGTLLFIPCCVCLLLALQWGGTTYAWNSWRVILLLVLTVVLAAAFVAVQIWKGELATVPPRIIKKRSIWAGVLYTFMIAAAMMIFIYYIPLWFQAIKNVDAVESGIRSIPLVLSLVLASIIGGAVTTKVGYYVPNMLICPVIMSIGAGLITTWEVDTGSDKWIGYQVLFGFGLGLGMQTSVLAAQVVLDKKDVPIGTALMMFAQQLGGAVFVSVGQNIFTNQLAKSVDSVPGLDASVVMSAGATQLQSLVPPEYLPQVLVDYNAALIDTFYAAVAASAVAVLFALPMEWRSVKQQKPTSSRATSASQSKEHVADTEDEAEKGVAAGGSVSEKRESEL